MVNFRRVVTVLAMLALFTGLAFAQAQESCSVAQGTVSNPLRAEGYTELVGDIVITCTGGQPLFLGTRVPLVNITVFFNTTVTSRLFTTPAANNAGQVASEALLLIDEPATAAAELAGPPVVMPGAALPLKPCTTPSTGCEQIVGALSPLGHARATLADGSQAQNAYQGMVQGASVSFYGIPALPPSTIGTRTYRITNVRVNATTGGAAAGTTPVQAFIQAPGFPIQNAQPTVGFIQPGLKAAVSGAKGFNQCVSATQADTTTTLQFTELFGSAFKTRVIPTSTASGAGQLGIIPNFPAPGSQGTVKNDSESGYVFTGFASGVAGLADYGTRLKATFNNVPSGVRVFVNSANTVTPTNPGNNSTATYAAFVGGDGTASDGSGVTFTTYAATSVSEVSIVNGTGTAVWEVYNTNPNFTETVSFGVFISFTAATATNSPLPGTATVTLTYAPTATSGVASSTLSIPRFSVGNSPFTGTVFTINVCRTILLYPYLTNQLGFDTGVTVANTSQDPFTIDKNITGAQAGVCTFTFYGGTTAAPTTPPAPFVTPTVAAGTVWANTLGTIAPNFQGYAFAICNFQYAHGFAFISDVGARNLAMGYLALIIPDPGALTGIRAASPACQGISGCSATGEQDAH